MTDVLDTISLGELLVDLVAAEAGTSLADTSAFHRAPGGAPANVAVGLARLGIRCGFVGKVGNDPFGHYLAGVLESEGVDIAELRFDDRARTALAFVSLGGGGERDFLFYRHPSADMMLEPHEMSEEYIRRARSFHFGSLTLAAEPVRSATLEALDLARRAGLLVSFDPNLRTSLWKSEEAARSEIRAVMRKADVVKVSEEELEFLAGSRGMAAARDLLTGSVRLLLVTRGPAGASYLTSSWEGEVPGFPVAAVDTTGAGDSFTAAFLARLARDRRILDDRGLLADAVRYANAAGALATLRRGAIPALPRPSEIDEMLSTAAGSSRTPGALEWPSESEQ